MKNSGFLSHPPALRVFCLGFPPGPRQRGRSPLWRGPYSQQNDSALFCIDGLAQRSRVSVILYVAGGAVQRCASRVLKTLSTIPLTPFLPGRGKEFVSEGHPFGRAQGKLSDSRQKGFAPLHSPFIRLTASRGGSRTGFTWTGPHQIKRGAPTLSGPRKRQMPTRPIVLSCAPLDARRRASLGGDGSCRTTPVPPLPWRRYACLC